MEDEKKEEQKEVKLRIKGMTCTSCASSIGTNLKKMDGVDFAGVNLVDKTALVKYDPKKVNVVNRQATAVLLNQDEGGTGYIILGTDS